jgi:hypothetical protein
MMREYTSKYNPRQVWKFGKGTHNPRGDYYVDGKYETSSIYSEKEIQGFTTIIYSDPDLAVAKGL